MIVESCKICGSSCRQLLVDFGAQPLCNRYLSAPDEVEECFEFKLVQCRNCGVVQLGKPVPPYSLKSRYHWITYNEQEGHLDDLVERICRLPDVCVRSKITGISYKDDTTVARFSSRGFSNLSRIDIVDDLGIEDSLAGLETIQAVMTPERTTVISQKRGVADILICRHIIEHAHQPALFAEALRSLVKPGGYVIFEVPDCLPALQRHDYSMPWEEHVVYYTPKSLARSIGLMGFSIVEEICYPYSQENSLVIIAQAIKPAETVTNFDVGEELFNLARAYGDGFADQVKRVSRCLSARSLANEKTAVFGAGHLSCFWLNVMKAAEHVTMVVDDHPQKVGRWMPGSRLPIVGSAALLEKNVTLCLLSLSPESEQRVMEKSGLFLEKGGTFASIFAGRLNSI